MATIADVLAGIQQAEGRLDDASTDASASATSLQDAHASLTAALDGSARGDDALRGLQGLATASEELVSAIAATKAELESLRSHLS